MSPLKEYTHQDLKTVTNDPLYKEFLDFKNEMVKKLGHALELEKAEEQGSF